MATITIPSLVGAKITKIRKMSEQDAVDSGLPSPENFVIELDNGITLVPLMDPEGNGPGCLTGLYKKKSFYVQEEN